MGKSSLNNKRKTTEHSTIPEGEGGIVEGDPQYYGRNSKGGRSRPPITGLHDAIRPILDKLDNQGSRPLQEATILGIVERYIFGEGFDKKAFWDMPGLPNPSTYKKWRSADPTASDPTSFVSILEEAKKAGLSWRSQQASKRVEMAHDLLQHFAPELVESLISIALDSKNDFAKLQAATAGLDRASERVAPKGQTSVNLPGLESAIEKIYGGVDLEEDTAEEIE